MKEVIAAEKGRVDLERRNEGIVIPEVMTNEEFDSGLSSDSFKLFLDVLHMKPSDKYEEKGNIIYKAMAGLKMAKREKGDVSFLRKFKSIAGRWFGIKKEKTKEKEFTLQRGSIVRLSEDGNIGTTYMVFVVWKIQGGGKKWFPSIPNDNPTWPVKEKEIKTYRLGVREVDLKDGTISYKRCEELVHGVNVKKTYKRVDLDQVRENLFKVNVFMCKVNF